MQKTKLIAAALIFVFCNSSFAVSIKGCDEASITLNQVIEMRMFANGGVKLFNIDKEEPAAMPVGIAVTIDRGSDLSEMESFCRYVSGLSHADLKSARANYNTQTALLTVEIPVRSYSGDSGDFESGTLFLVIDKAGKKPRDLVSATLR